MLAKEPYEALTDASIGTNEFTAELEAVSADGVSVSWWYVQTPVEATRAGERAKRWLARYRKVLSQASYAGFFALDDSRLLERAQIEIHKEEWLEALATARCTASSGVLAVIGESLEEFSTRDPSAWILLALAIGADFAGSNKAATIAAVFAEMDPRNPGWADEFHAHEGTSSWFGMRMSAAALGQLHDSIGGNARAILSALIASKSAFGLLRGLRSVDAGLKPASVVEGLRRAEELLRETRNRVVHPVDAQWLCAQAIQCVILAAQHWEQQIKVVVGSSERSRTPSDASVPREIAPLVSTMTAADAERIATELGSKCECVPVGRGFGKLLSALGGVRATSKLDQLGDGARLVVGTVCPPERFDRWRAKAEAVVKLAATI